MKDILKGRKSASLSQPPAELEPRRSDLDLPAPLYTAVKALKGVGERTLPRSPGTLRLRAYLKGEVICRQGDQGWTAFAILSADDVRAVHAERDKLLKDLPGKIDKATAANKADDAKAASELLAELTRARLPAVPTVAEAGPAATVYLDSSRAAPVAKPGLLARLFSPKKKAPARRPRFISVDAPTTIDYGTRKADLPEGALFGEWSCLYGT